MVCRHRLGKPEPSCVSDRRRWRRIGERIFRHGGVSLAEMAAWLIATSSAGEPACISIAIEVPHGPVVETLIERGFAVHAINPKQMNRFRDRFTLAGAKYDSRDAETMVSGLRTDPRCSAASPLPTRWSSVCASGRASPRISAPSAFASPAACPSSFGVIFPVFLGLDADLGAEWLLELWGAAPTPAKVRRIREASVARLLKRARIRRLTAANVLDALRQPPITLAEGTVEAARAISPH